MVSIYLNFKGNAKEVMEYYAEVFNTKVEGEIFTYGQMPDSEEFPMDEATKGLVLNAMMMINGTKFQFADVVAGMEFKSGTNITFTVELDDSIEFDRQFSALAKDGTEIMPMGETFWAKKYGYVVDKFGIGWQFNEMLEK